MPKMGSRFASCTQMLVEAKGLERALETDFDLSNLVFALDDQLNCVEMLSIKSFTVNVLLLRMKCSSNC